MMDHNDTPPAPPAEPEIHDDECGCGSCLRALMGEPDPAEEIEPVAGDCAPSLYADRHCATCRGRGKVLSGGQWRPCGPCSIAPLWITRPVGS